MIETGTLEILNKFLGINKIPKLNQDNVSLIHKFDEKTERTENISGVLLKKLRATIKEKLSVGCPSNVAIYNELMFEKLLDKDGGGYFSLSAIARIIKQVADENGLNRRINVAILELFAEGFSEQEISIALDTNPDYVYSTLLKKGLIERRKKVLEEVDFEVTKKVYVLSQFGTESLKPEFVIDVFVGEMALKTKTKRSYVRGILLREGKVPRKHGGRPKGYDELTKRATN